jgi:H+-transporting ATPase
MRSLSTPSQKPPLKKWAMLSHGLTTAEARARLRKCGPNSTGEKVPSAWHRAVEKFCAPVPCMLEVVILFELMLGDYLQAAIIAILLTLNTGLRFFQESRIQATFDVLKSRLALNACVRRDGAWSMIPAAQLVPGDIIKLSLGMVVSADARVIDGNVLLSQSMLTGEPLLVQISHVVGGPA